MLEILELMRAPPYGASENSPFLCRPSGNTAQRGRVEALVMCAAGAGDQCPFYIGQRVDNQGYHGTVRYVGEVSDQIGVWLGVEWDDCTRGRHDGMYNGKQYFSTSHPTSGSFVRPSKVSTGYSCAEAIHSRYGKKEGLIGGIDAELLLETKREIRAPFVEMVGFEQVNAKQSEFKNLKVVILTNEPVSSAGDPGQLATMCPQITELNLCHTLISDWKTLADITKQLPHLKQLDLSNNRLSLPHEEDIEVLQSCFKHIKHLVLINVGYSWEEILFCTQLWPNVEVLVVPNNNISTLEAPKHGILFHLQILHLNLNPILDWEQVNTLGKLERLEVLGLSETGLKSICFPDEMTTSLFPQLKTLWLANNFIDDWDSINELNKLPALENLIILSNPIFDRQAEQGKAFEICVARIKGLKKLNNLEITAQERKASEYVYMKHYGQAWLAAQSNKILLKDFHVAHPRYSDLIKTHGAFEEGELTVKSAPLKSEMITVTIFNANDDTKPQFKKRLPRNMSIQKLLGLAQKLIATGGKTPFLTAISSKVPDAKVVLVNTLQDLSYYSIEDGDSIAVHW